LPARLATPRPTPALSIEIDRLKPVPIYLRMRGAAGTFMSPSLPASVMRASRAQCVQAPVDDVAFAARARDAGLAVLPLSI
jgi:hypothetical protein